MMKRCSILILLTCLFLFAGCVADKNMVEAIVVDSGDITYEGCGYLLQLEDKALIQPMNLPSAYHHDGMKVKVKYKHTGVQDTCPFGTVIYDLVNVEKIKRSN